MDAERLPSAALRTLDDDDLDILHNEKWVCKTCMHVVDEEIRQISDATDPICSPGNCSRYGSMPTLERDRNGVGMEKATSIKNLRPRCDLDLRDFQTDPMQLQDHADGMGTRFDQWNMCFHSKPRGHPTCLLPETFSPCSLR